MLISLIIYSVLKLYLMLNIYQQSHYHIKSYLKHFLLNFIYYDGIPILLVITGLVFDVIAIKIICAIYLFIFGIFYLFTRIHLIYTKRILITMVLALVYIIGMSFVPYIKYVLLLIIEFIIIPIFLLEQFISYLFNNKYIKEAKTKIFDYQGKIIAVTGSAGKTSVKNLLNQALNLYTSSSTTPKSHNTVLGISKYINNLNIHMYENLVLEFGSSHVGDIKKLKTLAPPCIGFITGIDYMHMDTFKTLENVTKEKLSLLDGCYKAVVNYECEHIRKNIKFNGKVISYGFNYGDYRAVNILDGNFDVYYKDEFLDTFKCKLIGKHQILNLLGVIAYIHSEGFDIEIVKRGMLAFETPANRLTIKNKDNITILDDSYNSNYNGFKEALSILGKCEGKRFLLTPGIVELGKYKRLVYEKLVEHIIDNVDVVILVGYYQTKTLYKLLKNKKIDVFVTNNFNRGYDIFMEMKRNIDKCSLLIENDIPDLYRVGLV